MKKLYLVITTIKIKNIIEASSGDVAKNAISYALTHGTEPCYKSSDVAISYSEVEELPSYNGEWAS